MRNKKAAINSINKNDQKCFQYASTFALNYEEIGKLSEGIIKIKSFVDKYNWE